MEPSLQTIDKLVDTLKKLQPLKPEYQQRLDKKIRLEFNYNSNHIEGNTLTYGETELLLIFDKTTGNHELREYEEMKSHDVAFEMIKEWATDKERPLNEMAIKNLHEVLLVRPFWKEALTADGQPTRRLIKVGSYKEHPNSVRLQNGEMFHYTSPENTPVEMGELIQWYRDEEEKGESHPIVLAALLHYKFVRIHPFDDGNGRISRLLMNYVLLKHNLPPVIIKFEDKKNYLFALNQADTGDMNAFVNYIVEQLDWSLKLSIKAAKGELIDEPGDWSKKLFLLKRTLGENPNDKIELTLGETALTNTFNNAFIPIGFRWEEKLKEFDTLLMSRKMNVLFGKQNYGFNHLDTKFLARCKAFFNNEQILKKDRKLTIQCKPQGLRKGNKTVGFNGGEFRIELFDTSYELSYTNHENFLNKLYHQTLSEGEIETIVNDLSSFLYNNIEQFIDNNK